MTKENLLTTVFMRIRPRLQATAGRIQPGDDEATADALQEAFCRLWSRRHSISSESHAEGALMTTVRNVCIDNLRHSSLESRSDSQVPITDETATADPTEDTSELYDEVNRIISRALSERDREILLLRDRNGYEMDALAARFGLSEANIRIILSRARRTVRECYRKNRQP